MSRPVQRGAIAVLLAVCLVIPTSAAVAGPAAPDGPVTATTAAKKKKKKSTAKKRCRYKMVRGKRKKVCTVVKPKKKAPARKPAPSGGGGTGGGGGTTTTPSGSSGGEAPAPQPPAEEPIPRFRKALTGSRLYRISYSSSSNASVEQWYDFCDGIYRYRKDSNVANSYTTGWQGAWEVLEAYFNQDGSFAQGRVRLRPDQSTWYAYVNGAHDDTENPPQESEVIITLTASGPAYVGEQEFSRQASPGCG